MSEYTCKHCGKPIVRTNWSNGAGWNHADRERRCSWKLAEPADLPDDEIVYAVTGPERYDRDFDGLAFATSGELLYSHISSSIHWAKIDLAGGLGRRTDMTERYPEGYDIIYVEQVRDLPEAVQEAINERRGS